MSVDISRQIIYYKDFDKLEGGYEKRFESLNLTCDINGDAPEWDSENQTLKNISGCEFYYTGNDKLLKTIKVKSADGKQYAFFDVAEKKWLDNPDSIPLAAASYAMDVDNLFNTNDQSTWKDYVYRYDKDSSLFPQSLGITPLYQTTNSDFRVDNLNFYGWADPGSSDTWRTYIRSSANWYDQDHWDVVSHQRVIPLFENFTNTTTSSKRYRLHGEVLYINDIPYYVGPNAHLCVFERRYNDDTDSTYIERGLKAANEVNPGPLRYYLYDPLKDPPFGFIFYVLYASIMK